MRVVVCGAGVIGASVAYYLAERGVGATVIERAGVACAASGKAGGFLARDWCDGSPLGPLARASFALHRELARCLPEHGYRPVETLLVREGSTAGSGGPAWLSPGAGASAVIGTPEDTAQVHPERFTRALLDSALARGARLREGVVEEIVVHGGGAEARVRGVRVSGELVPADTAVIALGPWSSNVAGLPLPRVGGLLGNSIVLRPRAPVPAQCLFLETHDPRAGSIAPEIYPRPDGEVYVCGMADDRPFPADPLGIGASEAACEVLEGIAARVSDRLAGAEVVRRQACFRPVTADGLPLLGPVPGVAGAYVATGHSCWGILNAPASGHALVELILDGAPRLLDLSPYDPGRFHQSIPRRAPTGHRG